MDNKHFISVPCNWKYDLLDEINEDPNLLNVVSDFYGAMDRSFTGSGRPFFIMQKKERSDLETYINRVYDMGLKFTWLWNGKCNGYRKFSSKEQSIALKELDWLDDMNIEYLTVVDPYLAKFSKHYHPKLKIKVSLIAEVISISQAYAWQDIIGKDGIINLSVMANRNFPLLKQFAEKLDCDIQLLLNDACVNECPLRFFHYSETAHASQTHDVLEGFYNDWSVIGCQNIKAFNPEQVLMAKWIQPSDLDYYMEYGINKFKISGRRFATHWIIDALKAYAKKSYDENLGEFLNGYNFQTNPLVLAGSQFTEYAVAQEKAGGYPDDEDLMIGIPNYGAELQCDKLKSFMKDLPFQGSRCIENCGVACEYCHNFVDKAYILPSKERIDNYLKYSSYMYKYINKGEMFVPKEERTLVSPIHAQQEGSIYGIPWSSEATKFLDTALVLIPESMVKSASKAIKHISERTAERLQDEEVTKELVIKILIQLVPTQFKHDLIDFLRDNKINLDQFLKKNDIEAMEALPYSSELVAQINSSGDNGTKTKEEWQTYLTNFMKKLNEETELRALIQKVQPLVLQYQINDNSNMNYWQLFNDTKMNWGFDKYNGPANPTMIHKTDFETLQKVLSGEIDPIQATMAGKYAVEGDMEKLMECVPLIALYTKAHEKTR